MMDGLGYGFRAGFPLPCSCCRPISVRRQTSSERPAGEGRFRTLGQETLA